MAKKTIWLIRKLDPKTGYMLILGKDLKWYVATNDALIFYYKRLAIWWLKTHDGAFLANAFTEKYERN